MSEARVDQWLWAVRVYKTRTAASDACRGGHVRVNGRSAKPATPVRAGDRVTARLRDWTRELEVVEPITRRVGAKLVAGCYVDHSEPRPKRDDLPAVAGYRPRGLGRPTKRDRRITDRFRRGR